jgi:hypothetical protein
VVLVDAGLLYSRGAVAELLEEEVMEGLVTAEPIDEELAGAELAAEESEVALVEESLCAATRAMRPNNDQDRILMFEQSGPTR